MVPEIVRGSVPQVQGWRKQFHIGQANSSNMDIHVWKAGLPIGFREHDVQVLLCIAQSACKAC